LIFAVVICRAPKGHQKGIKRAPPEIEFIPPRLDMFLKVVKALNLHKIIMYGIKK
jgi:hypothetical protein